MRRAGGALGSVVLPLVVTLAWATCGGDRGVGNADLVLRGGRILTMDSVLPEAEALAVRGERIVAVGSRAEIAAYVGGGTRVVELEEELVLPGLIDGHGHYMSLGESLTMLDLRLPRSWEEIVALVAAAAAGTAPGEWIVGRGWHQDKWDGPPSPSVEGLPVHHSLSDVTPDSPVMLIHVSGHGVFVNRRALEAIGVTRDTPDPEGGEFVRDGNGDPTGMLREAAQELARAAVAEWRSARPPQEIDAEFRRQVALAGAEAVANGITTFHDMGESFETIDRLKVMAEEGNLPVRLYVHVEESAADLEGRLPEHRLIGYGGGFLTVRAIGEKVLDGALGVHGGWLLDIYEDVFSRNPDKGDWRWRIEHCQVIHPDDIPRFPELGVIASVRGVFATSDGPWVVDRLGEERTRERGYPNQTLFRSGAVVVNGTDPPVEDIDPVMNFYYSVSRRMADGRVFQPEQRMSREQALASYTVNPAYAAFEEELKGTLTPGKLADITVLSRDIMTIPEEEIPDVEVVYTIIGGEVRYAR